MTRTGFARPLGMLGVLAGGASVLVSVAFLDWYDYSGSDTIDGVRFADLAVTADRIDVPGIVPAYFDWLAWVLLIGVVTAATIAHLQPRAARALRIAGFLLGGLGSFLTWYALQQIKSYGDEGTYALHQATAGVWLTLIGFAVAGLGAAIGPRRV